MFPKGKTSTVPSDNDAKEKLANYVYEYLIYRGATKAAQTFLQEIKLDKAWALTDQPGFLNQWWCVFYDLYSAAPGKRETFEHSSEAKAFHDYGFVNSGYPNGLSRKPSNASPISGGMPPSVGRPPSSQGILPPDNGIHTPVSIQNGQMLVPNGHFFAPNYPQISNMDMRTRPMMPQVRYQSGVQMMGNYNMPRHRYSGSQSSGPLGHSPGPSGPPQSGPSIMPSPGDSVHNEQQQQNTPGSDSFGLNGPSRSPAHGMSQPAPAFPPPPAPEHNSEQSHPGMMNGGNNTPMPQFSPHQSSHTMEYLPSNNNMSFDQSLSQMKHSPQLHNPPSMGDVIASMNNGMNNDFCNAMIANGQSFSSDHGMRVGQPPLHMNIQPISQMQMMQQGLVPHHGPHSMQSMTGGPSLSGPFMPHHSGAQIGTNPQFPDYSFTSMSQAI